MKKRHVLGLFFSMLLFLWGCDHKQALNWVDDHLVKQEAVTSQVIEESDTQPVESPSEKRSSSVPRESQQEKASQEKGRPQAPSKAEVLRQFKQAPLAGEVQETDYADLLPIVQRQLEQGNYQFVVDVTAPQANGSALFEKLRHDLYGTYYGIVLDYANAYSYQASPNQLKVLLTFRLHHDPAADQAIRNYARNFASQIQGKSDHEKVRLIHDAIIDQAHYYLGEGNEVQGVSIYSPACILSQGTGVCQAYAGLFQMMCDESGVKSLARTGTAYHNAAKDQPIDHAWNLVQVNGKWLGVDTTWDDPVDLNNPQADFKRYDYFLVDLSDTHFADDKIR
ncbi:hypothetical protein CYJ29_05465 [Aerococcus loyolae]|uniref:Uncharacterized protein n=1 Tax=Aerococcus urinae TaxID=1376 RepID=A0A2I1L6V0_9LACT|nr:MULTISPECIES: transglutaminase domain-containing protein [Aerococcus]MDK6727891.1 transglutaminase domain-containing protein [Aerococcus urinae]MDK7910349.1 transglutaminase domain-containing protein [Aerococcus urinae]MDK8610092.1 transglutaminase domain-containing protein [Aerococcus urinae]MDL5183090.1 transglutaminase domain-containing protein [Aerococcus loyolae]PKY85677.1 hypothetical protein CYJ30_04905 [Aerococcus loyolae]